MRLDRDDRARLESLSPDLAAKGDRTANPTPPDPPVAEPATSGRMKEALLGFVARAGTTKPVSRLLDVLAKPPRPARLDPVTKRFLRSARDQNVDALMGRSALGLVNGNDGYYRTLNPNGETIRVVDVEIGNVEQRYLLIDLVRDLLRTGFDEVEVDALVAEAADGRAPEDAIAALLAAGRMKVVRRERSCDVVPGPKDLGDSARRSAAERLSRVRWIEAALEYAAPGATGHGAAFNEDLGVVFGERDADAVFEAIDRRFEAVMTAALARDLRPTSLTHLDTVAFERRGAERAAPSNEVAAARLGADHSVRRALADLERRIERGERSAVGGADYATQTFPEEILEAVASGQIGVVAFDGDREAGIRYVRDRHATLGRSPSCRVMGLQGIYGSYPRSLVTLDDGKQYLLVTGYGASRQLNNAAMLLLYPGRDGRVRAADIDLATDGGDRVAQFRNDIERAIDADGHGAIPTRLMIIQNPQHLERALPGRITWGTAPDDALVPMRVAIVEKKDGTTERVIVPKVGGGGVYGDTAGDFVTAFFASDRAPLIDDVVFNGTTGGFANTRQLPDVAPGGFIAPTATVEEYGDGNGPLALPTRLAGDPATWPAEVRRAVEAAGVHRTEHHVAVPAPSVETFDLIHELVAADKGSVDVEAGAIVRAVTALRAEGRPVTFTPLYTHSDDPRSSEHDRFDSLAMMGPLFEGSKFDAPLFDVLVALAGW